MVLAPGAGSAPRSGASQRAAFQQRELVAGLRGECARLLVGHRLDERNPRNRDRSATSAARLRLTSEAICCAVQRAGLKLQRLRVCSQARMLPYQQQRQQKNVRRKIQPIAGIVVSRGVRVTDSSGAGRGRIGCVYILQVCALQARGSAFRLAMRISLFRPVQTSQPTPHTVWM